MGLKKDVGTRHRRRPSPHTSRRVPSRLRRDGVSGGRVAGRRRLGVDDPRSVSRIPTNASLELPTSTHSLPPFPDRTILSEGSVVLWFSTGGKGSGTGVKPPFKKDPGSSLKSCRTER